MRSTLLPLFAAFLHYPGYGQLLNGSFEENGDFSLLGWEWLGDVPNAVSDPPPGGGNWAMAKESSQFQAGAISYLYQRLPQALNGEYIALQAWVRCSSEPFCEGGYIGIGSIQNGEVTTQSTIGSNNEEWTYIELSGNFQLDAGDTAVVILSAGGVSGPLPQAHAHFDGVSTSEPPSGIRVNERIRVATYPVPAQERLFVGCAQPMQRVWVQDARGRVLFQVAGNGTNAAVDLTALSSGPYLVLASTADGIATARFVKQ
jgi:hypothetical protein